MDCCLFCLRVVCWLGVGCLMLFVILVASFVLLFVCVCFVYVLLACCGCCGIGFCLLVLVCGVGLQSRWFWFAQFAYLWLLCLVCSHYICGYLLYVFMCWVILCCCLRFDYLLVLVCLFAGACSLCLDCLVFVCWFDWLWTLLSVCFIVSCGGFVCLMVTWWLVVYGKSCLHAYVLSLGAGFVLRFGVCLMCFVVACV